MGKIVSCANTGTNCRYLRCQQLEKDRHCSPRVQQTLAWVVPIFHFSPTEMGSTHTPFTFPSCPPPPPQISATVRIPSLSRCLVGRNNQSVHLEEQFFRIHYKRNHFISIWRRRFQHKMKFCHYILSHQPTFSGKMPNPTMTDSSLEITPYHNNVNRKCICIRQ